MQAQHLSNRDQAMRLTEQQIAQQQQSLRQQVHTCIHNILTYIHAHKYIQTLCICIPTRPQHKYIHEFVHTNVGLCICPCVCVCVCVCVCICAYVHVCMSFCVFSSLLKHNATTFMLNVYIYTQIQICMHVHAPHKHQRSAHQKNMHVYLCDASCH
jgi:hypothetical protein